MWRFAHCFLLLQWYGAYEFLPEGHTVKKEYYKLFAVCLKKYVKTPEIVENQSWLLHHDNAIAHTSLLIRNFLANNKLVIMSQPPYSPDLALLWLFPVSKTEETHESAEICYDWGDKNCITGRAQDYTKKCLWEVLRGLEKVLAQVYYIWGNYFEGDNIDIDE